LDLGCGPGFCTRELAYIAGDNGKVIGVDLSKSFIDFIKHEALTHGLNNIDLRNCDYDDLILEDESLDGIYNRWALAWIPNPEEIISKLYKALKPGGVIVSQEYYEWSIFQTEPILPALERGIKMAFKTFEDSTGEINVGRRLSPLYIDEGMEVISMRTISKVGFDSDLTWQWPKTFLEIYIPKLEEMGYLTHDEVRAAIDDLYELENIEGSSIVCPLMCEVVAVKT